jgi:hypothetical protein
VGQGDLLIQYTVTTINRFTTGYYIQGDLIIAMINAKLVYN